MSNVDTKLFTVAGTSLSNGSYKARFAQDVAGRVKMLERYGDTDVVLVELPNPMTKTDAIAFLQESKPEGVNLGALVAKETSIITRNTPRATKATKTDEEKAAEKLAKETAKSAKAVERAAAKVAKNLARDNAKVVRDAARAAAQAAKAAKSVAEPKPSKTTKTKTSGQVSAEDSTGAELVNTIVNSARKGNSIRAKAQAALAQPETKTVADVA